VQHHRVRHSRRIPYLISASPIRFIRVFTCKRIGLSLVLSLVFIAAFLNISARIDYSLDLQILNNTHRPDGGSPKFTTFGASFKVRQVARKTISQFLLIFPLSCATGTLLTTALPTVRLPARTSSSKKTAFCRSFFCPCSFPPLPMLRESRPHSGCLACTESLAESPVAWSRSRLHNVCIYSDILAVTATPQP
jgi:hypothetical protein